MPLKRKVTRKHVATGLDNCWGGTCQDAIDAIMGACKGDTSLILEDTCHGYDNWELQVRHEIPESDEDYKKRVEKARKTVAALRAKKEEAERKQLERLKAKYEAG